MVLAAKSFGTINSVFNNIEDHNSFFVSTPRYWTPKGTEEFINRLREFLELRSQNVVELHVKEVEKRSTSLETENGGYYLTGFDHFKCEILAR